MIRCFSELRAAKAVMMASVYEKCWYTVPLAHPASSANRAIGCPWSPVLSSVLRATSNSNSSRTCISRCFAAQLAVTLQLYDL